MQVYVRIKSLDTKKSSTLISYELPEGIEDVRTLIASFVHAEVERYNQKDTERPLLALLNAEEIEQKAGTGKVSFGRLWSDRKAEEKKALDTAFSAFRDGLFRVLMDEEELTGLDMPVTVPEGAVFTFVRLTFLAGRMW